METLINDLSKENFINNDDGFQRFCDISLNALNKHAPCKKKHARGNQMPFLNKDLSKAIMTRTKLRNIFLQNKSEENKTRYTKQRNFSVSLLRKTKKRYYENLNEKSVVDNKLFWKTVKPLLSDKVMGKDHIHFVENDELIKTDLETAEVFNNFFSNIVQNLKISRYTNEEPIVSNISDPTLKPILKYRNHPSITAIQNRCKIKGSFNFVEVDQQQIEKEILKLDANKASQSSDIPIKIIKENIDVFSDFLCSGFNSSIKLSKFPENLKQADITPAYKKVKKISKETIDQSAFSQICQKYLKNLCSNKCHNFFKTYFLNTNADFEKVSVLNTAFWQC